MLAGIVVSNVLPYLESIYYLPSLWRQSPYDCVSVDALAEVGADEGKAGQRETGQTKDTSAEDASNSDAGNSDALLLL